MSMWTAIALIAIAAIVAEAYRHHNKDRLSKADQKALDALNQRLLPVFALLYVILIASRIGLLPRMVFN